MKIKAKIFGGFLTIIILLFAGAFITVFQFVKLNHNNRQLLDENKQYSSAMYNVNESLNLYNDGVLSLLTDTDRQAVELISKADSLYNHFVIISKELYKTEDEKILLKDFNEDFQKFRQYWVASFFKTHDLQFYLSTKEPEFKILRSSLSRLMLVFQNKLLGDSEALYEHFKRALTPGIVTIIASLLLILMFNMMFNRYYINPLSRLTDAVNKFHYKRSFKVEIETDDEIGKLAKSIEELTKLIKK